MAPIHIDETIGSDDTGKGTKEEPYKSLGQALFSHGGDSTASYLIRKDQTVQYDEPTQSSLKKAKKTADGIEKKKKKQEELAERNAKEKGEEVEKREKLLEESKKIILEEDISLPKATKVRFFLFLFFISKLFLTEIIILFNSRKLYI
jgi:asparaginyl-tRNA synthetase